jgi:hypothetical protein
LLQYKGTNCRNAVNFYNEYIIDIEGKKGGSQRAFFILVNNNNLRKKQLCHECMISSYASCVKFDIVPNCHQSFKTLEYQMSNSSKLKGTCITLSLILRLCKNM